MNLFNGGVSLSIPIGQDYSLGGGLSYGWTLTYNSKLWDYEEVQLATGEWVTAAWGNRRSNAGFGWYLGLGELIDPSNPSNDSDRFVYISSDGAPHYFYDKLHYTEAPNGGDCYTWNCLVAYSQDGSYLRMRRVTGPYPETRAIDFPDGRTQTFIWQSEYSRWALSEIRDTFGNFVLVESPYLGSVAECAAAGFVDRYTDSAGRSQTICYKKQQYNNAPPFLAPFMVWRVILSAFGETSSIWEFEYEWQTVQRGCGHEAGAGSNNLTMAMLARIITPVPVPPGTAAEDYRFRYFLNNAYPNGSENCQQGAIERLQLPTKGAIEWTWQPYNLRRHAVSEPCVRPFREPDEYGHDGGSHD